METGGCNTAVGERVLRVVDLGEVDAVRQLERLADLVAVLRRREWRRAAVPLDGDMVCPRRRQPNGQQRRSHRSPVKRAVRAFSIANHGGKAGGERGKDESERNSLGQAAGELKRLAESIAAPGKVEVFVLQRRAVPFHRKAGADADGVGDEVGLDAEEAFDESAGGDAEGVAEVALRLLAMHVERGGHVEVAGAEAHEH